MSELVKNKATICIVNYKTLNFTKLCLRSIRKFTHYPYEVIVVDNNSQDESLEYLKSLKWIRLLQRDTSSDIGGGYSHGAALQLGIEHCNTEFFVSMHSDTFVQKNNWLMELISHFNNDKMVACIGSGKIELTARWRKWLKAATDLRNFKRKLLREPDLQGKYRYYNRTICCLYRTDVLNNENLSFLPDRDKELTAGKRLYFKLVDRGYKTVELPAKVLGQYVIHLAHATQAVNPAEFTLRKKTIKKCSRRVKKVFSSGIIQQILNDNSLDK